MDRRVAASLTVPWGPGVRHRGSTRLLLDPHSPPGRGQWRGRAHLPASHTHAHTHSSLTHAQCTHTHTQRMHTCTYTHGTRTWRMHTQYTRHTRTQTRMHKYTCTHAHAHIHTCARTQTAASEHVPCLAPTSASRSRGGGGWGARHGGCRGPGTASSGWSPEAAGVIGTSRGLHQVGPSLPGI